MKQNKKQYNYRESLPTFPHFGSRLLDCIYKATQFFKIKAEIFYLFRFPGKMYLVYIRDRHKNLGTLTTLCIYSTAPNTAISFTIKIS